MYKNVKETRVNIDYVLVGSFVYARFIFHLHYCICFRQKSSLYTVSSVNNCVWTLSISEFLCVFFLHFLNIRKARWKDFIVFIFDGVATAVNTVAITNSALGNFFFFFHISTQNVPQFDFFLYYKFFTTHFIQSTIISYSQQQIRINFFSSYIYFCSFCSIYYNRQKLRAYGFRLVCSEIMSHRQHRSGLFRRGIE